MSPMTSTLRGAAMAVTVIVLFHSLGSAQQASGAVATGSGDPAIRELQDQVRQLQALVQDMRAENEQSRTEMHQLRQDLQATRTLLERPNAAKGSEMAAQTVPEGSAVAAVESATPLEQRVQKLEESTSLIGSKIDEQYQTKVETASKYRARLHGIILMNAFRNVGGTNSVDFPDISEPVTPGGSLAAIGATLRQSQIGFEVFGPNLAGAKTSGDIQMDFAGGFSATGNGVNFGFARLQTASV